MTYARVIPEQRDEAEIHQALLRLLEEVKPVQCRMETKMDNLGKHMNMHLERMDKRASETLDTISEIRSHVHEIKGAVEENCKKISEPGYPSWANPDDMVELHAPQDDVIFHDEGDNKNTTSRGCLLYTSPSPRDATLSRMPSSA